LNTKKIIAAIGNLQAGKAAAAAVITVKVSDTTMLKKS
jgi:hypothetical protein